jgi:sarcosine oxidase subunit gamma
MLEARSPLGPKAVFEGKGVSLSESAGFTLTQVAGTDSALKKILGKLPQRPGVALEQDGRLLLRVAPSQIWVIGEVPEMTAGVYLTPLSSGRTRLQLEGPRARDVLAACAAIDFHESRFKPGQFVMTGIHHTPVLIHCLADHAFHIFAMRSFALSVWDWLVDAAEGL